MLNTRCNGKAICECDADDFDILLTPHQEIQMQAFTNSSALQQLIRFQLCHVVSLR